MQTKKQLKAQVLENAGPMRSSSHGEEIKGPSFVWQGQNYALNLGLLGADSEIIKWSVA